MHKRSMNYLEKFLLVVKNQFGFRKKKISGGSSDLIRNTDKYINVNTYKSDRQP